MSRLSVRLRVTALVTAVFGVVLVASSWLLLGWFEERLAVEVRADDMEELERQAELLALMGEMMAVDPTVAPGENFAAVANEVGLLTFVPDDGTFITVFGSDGEVLGTTGETIAAFAAQAVGPEAGTGLPTYVPTGPSSDGSGAGGQPGPGEPAARFQQQPWLYRWSEAEPPAETWAESPAAMRLLEDVAAAASPGPVRASNDFAAGRATVDRFDVMMSDPVYGAASSSAAGGRRVVTSLPIVVFGEEILLTAESRVVGVDAAVGAVQRTLRIGVPTLLALVAVLVYVATGRALRPVEAITGQVERIRSSGSVERVPVPETGDEINHLATTMNDMLDRLAASAESQRRFVSDVSHELRTPAAVIRAELEAAKTDPDNDWVSTADSVLTEQTRLSELVDDLILLARMDEGQLPTRREIDLDAVVEGEAGRSWRHPVSAGPVEPIKVDGDAAQLSRVVQNLLANAGRHATSTVAVSLERHDGHAVLRVDDDGSGVPADQRERVFDRFARLDEARERDAGGSGLGLAIVRQVAEAHGGSVRAGNSPMGGARFEVLVPVSAGRG